MEEMTCASIGKRRRKIVLKYDDGDDDDDEEDMSDKENAPIAKTFASKLTVKMPFVFPSKFKPKGKVKKTSMAAFFEGESGWEKESKKETVKGSGEEEKKETPATTSETTEERLDENGNVKPKRVKNEDDSDSDSDSDSDDDDVENIEKRRAKNLEDNKRMLEQMMAEFGDKSSIKPAYMRRTSLPSSKAILGDGIEKNPRNRRQSFGIVALQANRKSPPRTRSRGVDGQHVEGLKDEVSSLRRRIDYNENLKVYFDDSDDEENREAETAIKPEATRRRLSTKKATTHVVLPVEKVTSALLANICSGSVLEKVYDPINGTSCHQCRQKTRDTKTCCRAPDCVGVRGQFCGVCLKNRYGENADDALLDPDWKCPPCRGICNCSICRSRSGRCPTGILFNLSASLGYKSVHHFLAKQGKEGEKEEDD